MEMDVAEKARRKEEGGRRNTKKWPIFVGSLFLPSDHQTAADVAVAVADVATPISIVYTASVFVAVIYSEWHKHASRRCP